MTSVYESYSVPDKRVITELHVNTRVYDNFNRLDYDNYHDDKIDLEFWTLYNHSEDYVSHNLISSLQTNSEDYPRLAP